MRALKEIEYSFFGCIWDDVTARCLEAMKLGCKSHWFTEPSCQAVWTAIEEAWAKGGAESLEPLQIITRAQFLARDKKSEFYGAEINAKFYDDSIHYRHGSESEERSDIKGYSEILRAASTERRVREAIAKAHDSFSNQLDSSAVSSTLAKTINEILTQEAETKEVDVCKLIDDIIREYQTVHTEISVNRNYDYTSGYQLPWIVMTKRMNGLQAGGVHIIAARPSVGKTSFLVQLMMYWCEKGHKVLFNCLDMGSKQILKRPLANLSGVPISRAENWTKEEENAVIAAGKRIKEWRNANIFNQVVERNVNALKTKVSLLHARGELDILCIDYLQQMTCAGGDKMNENARITEVSAVLKSIAIELNIPVVCLSQLSRDNVKEKNDKGEARPPQLSDLRGSGAAEQDAFSVTFLYREEAVVNSFGAEQQELTYRLVADNSDPVVHERDAQAVDAVWVSCQKNQNGGTFKLPFVVHKNKFRWYLGDYDADAADTAPKNLPKFSRIMADWRFDVEPFISAVRNDAIAYPNGWARMCERMCEMRGIAIPPHMMDKVSLERMNERIRKSQEDRFPPKPSKPDFEPPPPTVQPTLAESPVRENVVQAPKPPSAGLGTGAWDKLPPYEESPAERKESQSPSIPADIEEVRAESEADMDDHEDLNDYEEDVEAGNEQPESEEQTDYQADEGDTEPGDTGEGQIASEDDIPF